MNPLTWSLLGWWLPQLYLLHSYGLAVPYELSVAVGMVGMWVSLVLCGMLVNRTHFESSGCLSFFGVWLAVCIVILAVAQELGLPSFITAIACFTAGPLGLWLMGTSQMSPLIVLGLVGTASFYADWGARLDHMGWAARIGFQLFLYAVLGLEMAAARRTRRKTAAPKGSDTPAWARRNSLG